MRTSFYQTRTTKRAVRSDGHVLFDALIRRHRYGPADIDDAHDMHRRYGRRHLDRLDPDNPTRRAITDSWAQLPLAPHDGREARRKAYIDWIESHEIISVTPTPATKPSPAGQS